MRTRRRSILPFALTSGLLVAALLGCFGQFQITRNVYAFNRTVSQDRFVRWTVFLAMNIAPVYPVGVVMDAFIANPVEFWSGTNPVKGSERWFPKQQPQTRLVPLPDGRVRVELARTGSTLYVRLAPDALLAWDDRGELLARVTDVDGQAALVGGSLRGRGQGEASRRDQRSANRSTRSSAVGSSGCVSVRSKPF